MAAGYICKLPDSLLLLLRDAHSPKVELQQGSAGRQARAQSGQALTAQCIPLHQHRVAEPDSVTLQAARPLVHV